MSVAHSPLVSAHQPALEQGDNVVHPGEQLRYPVLARGRLMNISRSGESFLDPPTISVDNAAGLDGVVDEGPETGVGGVGDSSHSDASDPVAVLLSSDHNQGLSACPAQFVEPAQAVW